MTPQRKQTLLLALLVALGHIGLLFALEFLWQPRSQIKRLPEPVFARLIRPEAAQIQTIAPAQPTPNTPLQSSTVIEAPTDSQSAATNPTNATAQTTAIEAPAPQTQATQTAASAPSKTAAPAPPTKTTPRKNLWQPLSADKAPAFRNIQSQVASAPSPSTSSTSTIASSTAPILAPLPTATPEQLARIAQAEQANLGAPTTETSIAPTSAPAATTAPAALAESTQPTQTAPNTVVLTDPMDAWPNSTRLRYRVGGNYRGKVNGSAQVQWVKQGAKYQSQVDMDFGIIPGVQMTSQGRIFPTGLQPTTFEEKQGVGGWKAVQFNISNITIHDGRSVPNPEKRIGHMLDPAAQFVEFSHRFRTGALPLKADTTFDFWLGRPEAIYRWEYSISGPMLLALPEYGDVVVHHVKPTPRSLKGRANKGYTVEMWYAPELQFLPVRIKLVMGKQNGYIDLMLQSIEQAES